MTRVEPFQLAVPDAALADLERRLGATRWPDQVGEDWAYGTPVDYLKGLCHDWAAHYDWRAWERRLNHFPQFTAPIEGQTLHFIHARSHHAAAEPILLCHGWPGSLIEFHKVIEPLIAPERHGGDPKDAFHVICPAIPGYGFSTAPRLPGFNARACAARFIELMKLLGYDRYFVQGGDWGAAIVTWMAALAPRAVRGVHLNMPISPPPRTDPERDVTAAERERFEARRKAMATEVGYQQIQRTKPQTLGYALLDSPAGLAGWIVEKFHSWTHHSGDHEQAISREEILTNLSYYWYSGSITSSMRLYFENQHYGQGPRTPDWVAAPTSVALYPGELYQPPRAWVARQFNLVRWVEMPRGGHFAALEEPDLFAADLRASCQRLRDS